MQFMVGRDEVLVAGLTAQNCNIKKSTQYSFRVTATERLYNKTIFLIFIIFIQYLFNNKMGVKTVLFYNTNTLTSVVINP
jgi:hypothetical protein